MSKMAPTNYIDEMVNHASVDEILRLCDEMDDDDLNKVAVYIYQRYLGASDLAALAQQEEYRLGAIVNIVQEAAIKRMPVDDKNDQQEGK